MATAFSTSLAKLRQIKGVSQRKAAGDLGVSQALLSHYENGIREPGLDFLCRACDYYQVSADSILGRTDQKGSKSGMPLRTEANSHEFDPSELTEIDCRLLSDSIAIIGKLLNTLEDRQLINDAYAYCSIALFRLVRDLSAREAEGIAAIEGNATGLVSDVAIKKAELDIISRIKECDRVVIPELGEEYPELYSSLVQVLCNAGIRINKLNQ